MRIPCLNPVNHQFSIATLVTFPGGIPLSKVLLALWQSGPRRRENSFPEIDKVETVGASWELQQRDMGLYAGYIYIYMYK